jgi:hypothetical protein
MLATTESIQTATYKSVRSTLFSKIHWCLTRNNYETLKKEASNLACKVEVITYDWTHLNTCKEYGTIGGDY